MSGIDFLADTNALIYLLDGNGCMKPYLQKSLALSVISEMELLSFHGITENEEYRIKGLIGACSVLPITESVKSRAIFLRKKYRTKLPDAIVAATAIENGLPLLTADKGFRQIADLNLILIEPTDAEK